jgi:hypothetical protein
MPDIEGYMKAEDVEALLKPLRERIEHLETLVKGPRIRLTNMEGCFKSLPSAPVQSDGFENGSIVFYEAGGVVRIYALVNGTWRYAALT